MEKMRLAHCASKRSGRSNRPRSRQSECAAGGRYGALKIVSRLNRPRSRHSECAARSPEGCQTRAARTPRGRYGALETALLAIVTACAAAGPVMADSIGPAGFPFGNFFTPPLAASQSTSVPISYHVTFGFINWAGVHFSANIDPTEANFMGFTPAPGFNTTGAAGSVTVWSTNASNSGQTVSTSVPFALGSLVLHAKGATPMKNNGDIDVVFQNVFNIFHVTPSSASALSTFLSATWVYLPPGATVSQWGQGSPPQVGDGSWVHLTATHTLHFALSWFWGTSGFVSATGGIGIENVPAPAGVAILLAGFGAVGFARRRRRT